MLGCQTQLVGLIMSTAMQPMLDLHQALIVCCMHLQSRLQTLCVAADIAELTPGSMFSVRVLVRSQHVRVLLKQFVGQPKNPAAGLTPELYDELLSHFQDTDHPLTPYLVCQH